jgi:Na+-transporting methylmalonyl-CoA/oxaloacetate decarboxylase beta subunit
VSDPKGEYAGRLEARLQAVARQERQHIRIGNAKLATVVAGVVVVWLALARHLFPLSWVLVPLGLYAVLAVIHERVLRARSRAERAAAFYRHGIARIEDRWVGMGNVGERFHDDKHVYAEDVDLFGRGGLFELLCMARTPMGEQRLADWLCAAAPVPVVLERQSMVAELREKLDLREDLALAGEELRGSLNPAALTKWAEGKRVLPTALWRVAAMLLVLAMLGTLIYGAYSSDYGPVIIILAIEAGLWRSFKQRVQDVIGTLNADAKGLALFSATLARLESETFASPRLRKFVDDLKEGGTRASVAIGRLARIAYWIEANGTFMMKLLDVPFLITIQVAFAAERWRGHWGRRMSSWIDAVAEIEALLSLAAYSWEHPRDPFPEFADPADGPFYDGDQLGHPLIPQDRCVTNSVRLSSANRILMVSGSNMSGKSTFLRVVGVNAVLAMAGAPIRGKSMRLSPFLLGTRLRTVDSLQENRSGFYTEILRIRQVFDLTGQERPVLFLFDEMLEGTNSKDRRIGAEGLLDAFLKRGAVGIVTTHDLALTEITGELGAAVSNAHLQDYVEEGRMRFDYKLRPGVVARSNAIELMRLVGLQV